MSEHPVYKYDVAFSFLAQDEALATELSDLLQDRVRPFLYSKKQGEIAGTDGEKSFNRVFGDEARIVVVLYRRNWGQTPWTRIEETAIKNRAYNEGYEFVIFIPLDDPPSAPEWLPRTRLWLNIGRWGVKAAAAVIEDRVKALGGEPKEETVLERAARLQRALEFREKRGMFLDSREGASAAAVEFEALRTGLEELVASLQSSTSISLQLKHNHQQIVLWGLVQGVALQQGLKVQWTNYYTNTIREAQLYVELWDGHPPYPGFWNHYEEPKKLGTKTFTFDILAIDQYCWRDADSESRIFSTSDFASFLLKYFMDKADTRSREP